MKAIWLAVVFAACGSSKPTATHEAAVVDGKVTSGGVDIAYDVRGNGDTALVFVHCWACDRTFWKDQLDAFASDYKVVALDLGGHGASGDTRSEWTIASLGGDVQAVVERLDLKKVILVGHSMGGSVSLDAARRMPGRVVGIVCADTLHDAELQMPAEMRDQVLAGFETDFAGTVKQGITFMFRPDSPKSVVDWVASKWSAIRVHVALPLMRELMTMDVAPLLAAAKVPIRCINAKPWTPMTPKTNVANNRKHADFDAVEMDGVGHFLQLEKPAEFNAELRTLLATWK